MERFKDTGIFIAGPKFTVLAGNNVGVLLDVKKAAVIDQAVDVLAQHPDTNNPVTKAELEAAVNNGTAIAVMDTDTFSLKGFGQLKPVVGNDQEGQPIVKALCFSSWFSREGGAGKEALFTAVDLGTEVYPGLPIIAKVRNCNERALTIMEKMGATVEARERGKTVFNITKVKGKIC